MKTVYLVAAHYAPDRFEDLIDALAPSVVIVHVDLKVNAAPFRAIAANFPEVVFVPEHERVDVIWGGWSQVAATLEMLKIAKSYIQPEDYVVLVSGDSFPLQNPKAIDGFLEANSGEQYINSVSMPSLALSKPLSRISHAYLEYNPRNGKRNLARRIFNKIGFRRNYLRAFDGRQPRAGSTWWALTGAAVMWLLNDIERDERFSRFCQLTKMPDEFFFQTLIGSSPYASNVRGSLMFTDWSRAVGPKPAVVDADHIRNLVSHGLVTDNNGYGPAVSLFARKVTDGRIAARIRNEIWPIFPAA